MTYFGPKGSAIHRRTCTSTKGFVEQSALVERGSFLRLGWLVGTAGRRGIGGNFLLGSRVYLDRHRSIGGVLVGHQLVHHNHGKHQHQQTRDSDGKGQRDRKTNRLDANTKTRTSR